MTTRDAVKKFLIVGGLVLATTTTAACGQQAATDKPATKQADTTEQRDSSRIVSLGQEGIKLNTDLVRLFDRGGTAADNGDLSTVCWDVLPEIKVKLARLDQVVTSLGEAGADTDNLRQIGAEQNVRADEITRACEVVS